MAEADDRERAQREAYAAYNRLQWRLAKLPTRTPERVSVVAELAAAERTWRRLRGGLESLVPTTPTPVDAPAPPAPAGGFWQRLRRALGGE